MSRVTALLPVGLLVLLLVASIRAMPADEDGIREMDASDAKCEEKDANSEYNSCGTACPDTCDNYQDTNRICTMQCVMGCQCKQGYVLNDEGKCVEPSLCGLGGLLD